MRYFLWLYALSVVTIVSILGFQGDKFKKPPLEVFPDMDRQLKLLEQSETRLFADRRADRLPPVGVVSRGDARDLGNVFSASPDAGSLAFRTGKGEDGEWVDEVPAEVGADLPLMRQGRDLYDVHCSACHGLYGNGRGITAHFGLNPKNLTDPSNQATYLEAAGPWKDGQIFGVISHGSESKVMLGMADKMTPRERWAVVLYLRALQSYVAAARADSSEEASE